jgi:hypothetical protein
LLPAEARGSDGFGGRPPPTMNAIRPRAHGSSRLHPAQNLPQSLRGYQSLLKKHCYARGKYFDQKNSLFLGFISSLCCDHWRSVILEHACTRIQKKSQRILFLS